MCEKIKRHWYCLRWNGKRYYMVHSCKTRKARSHKAAAHWVPMDQTGLPK